jgi:hypothetical protein
MLSFTIGFLYVFLLISVFIAYFLTGDISLYYYHDYGFIFLKVIQHFMRGSLDSIDQDLNIDVNKRFYKPGDSYSFQRLTTFTSGNPDYIPNQIGIQSYIIYCSIFFFIANCIVKVLNVAVFLTNYRNKYESDLAAKEIEKKKLEVSKGNLFEQKDN